MMVNRREFLIQSTAAALGGAAFQTCHGQVGPSSSPASTKTAELTIDLQSALHPMPLDYTGLSYELAELSNPDFFAASNKQLVALFRLLSPQGVLRLGGNSSESCWFKADGSTTAPALRPATGSTAENWMPQRLFMIEPKAIDRLAVFLNAANWKLIYGLNLGNSSPERAAKEAEYVAERVGAGLLYFQIGNEPDYYHNANNRTRPATWDFANYLDEWLQFVDAINQRVPRAKFGGPDVGSSSDWMMKFIDPAAKKLGARLMAVTGHYYAEGPPDNPKVNILRLLRNNPGVVRRTQAISEAAAKDNLLYRMTEGNSCYRGGKPGMSDAFASALWAGDYMLALASAGCAGVNLHGGSRDFLKASLGGHMPGELVQKSEGGGTITNATVLKGGFYTPIAGDVEVGFSARPIFYGMVLANQLAGTKICRATLNNTEGINATAYAGTKDGQLRVAIFNKDESHDLHLVLRIPDNYQEANIWRLRGPALDATSGVTLAGAEMSPDSGWSPITVESLPMNTDGPAIDIPQASGAIVFLKH